MISSNFDEDEDSGVIYPTIPLDEEYNSDLVKNLVRADTLREAVSKGIVTEQKDSFNELLDEPEEELPFDEEENEEDFEPNNFLTTIAEAIDDNKSKLVFIVIGVIGIIAISNFFSDKKPQSQVSEPKVQQPKFESTTQTIWGSTAGLDYSETIVLSDTYYTDEIVVTKFATFDDYSVQYYFSGIPKNFKQKIIFPVTVQEYNSVPSGGKIFIDYKIFSKDGKDYVADVSTSIKE